MMEQTLAERRADLKNWILLFIGMLVFRINLDVNYTLLLAGTSLRYPEVAFDPLRYAVSYLWCIGLFAGIRHNEERASSFLLYLMLLLQILPISTIYGLCGLGGPYYHVLCLAFLLCQMVTGCALEGPGYQRNGLVSNVMHWGYALVIPLVLAAAFLANGLPTLQALNILDVYELRGSGAFQVNKYVQYLLVWTTSFFVPMLMARAIHRRQYLPALALMVAQAVLYLYTGHKTYLFIIPLVLVCSFWSRRKNFYRELFLCLCGGFVLLTVLALLATYTEAFPRKLDDLLIHGDSYLCRRTLMVPAINKFMYFDYFSTHPKMGLGGIFPTWLVPLENIYAEIPYTFDISAMYYEMPEMNSNTGFLVEGFLRFGHLGTFFVLLVFAMLLRQMDSLQNRLGYALTVSIFIYPVFSLADGYLLDQLFFGRWMPILLFMFFCRSRQERQRRIVPGCRRVTLRG